MKTIILFLFLSTITLADSTDVKRLDDKLKAIEERYEKAEKQINDLKDLQKELNGAYKALAEEKKIAEQKLKGK